MFYTQSVVLILHLVRVLYPVRSQWSAVRSPCFILTVMIKTSSRFIKYPLEKLFNLILQSGTFPTSWSNGIITALHKSGNKDDPSNYRGICISSCLGKGFCSILNTRLLNFSNKHKILHRSQIGFLPGHRTSEHIFSLKTLIDQQPTPPEENFILVLLILRRHLTQFGIKVYYTNC